MTIDPVTWEVVLVFPPITKITPRIDRVEQGGRHTLALWGLPWGESQRIDNVQTNTTMPGSLTGSTKRSNLLGNGQPPLLPITPTTSKRGLEPTARNNGKLRGYPPPHCFSSSSKCTHPGSRNGGLGMVAGAGVRRGGLLGLYIPGSSGRPAHLGAGTSNVQKLVRP